ncbi:MAG: cache domain-containing protein [Arcobacteraceae bacterium]|nr:cache domain-containing protein [Arcobacteraceae bacterium]
MKNLSLNTKLFMIVLIEVIISTIILTTQSVKTIESMSHNNVIQYEKQVIKAKKEALKNYVDMAKGVLQIYRDKVTSTTTPLELQQIKNDAIKAMDSMVYGNDSGYVFVWSYDGVPLAFNPRPDLIGKNLLNLKGGGGKWVIKDHIANAKKGGGHFYNYKWKTTKDSAYQTKISYSFGVQDWRWFVGTGEYMSKEEKEIAQKKEQIINDTNQLIYIIMFSAIVLILIASTILYFLIRKVITKPLNNLKCELSNFFSFLQNKEEDISSSYVYANDEIGQMSKEINDNIQVSIKLHNELKDSEHKAKILNDTLEEKVKNRTLELKEQKETFEAIYNGSKDAIAILDMKSNFLAVNPAYLEMTGFSENELLSTSCLRLTHNKDVEASKKAIEEVLRVGFIKNFEKECIIKGNKSILTNMSMSLLKNPNRILISVRDITEQRYKDKLLYEQSKMASMGEMIGNIAHQWRQPLSVISTAATGMKMQKEFNMLTDKSFNETCKAINKNAQYLSKTIDDFSDFIKGDRNKTIFSLEDNVDSFLHLVEGSIKSYHIKIILDLEEDIKIDGYENELTQCLINIFNNAKDILNEKEVKDKLIFITTSIHDGNAIIKIKDNASGIPNDILPKIFEPYFTTKHKSQGTGLGLHMTYNLIVDGMGGNIEANNVSYEYKGKSYTGAEFIIILPLG